MVFKLKDYFYSYKPAPQELIALPK